MKPLEQDAQTLLLWYIGILNARQSTYDFAVLLSTGNMSCSVMASYVQTLCLFTIEAWSKAGLYSYIYNTPLDAHALQKGIRAVDNAHVTGPSFDVL
jgi:hypothetical protein